VAITLQRAATRLKSVFITFDAPGEDKLNTSCNGFWHPYKGNQNTSVFMDNSHDFQFQLSVGSKNYPEMPVRSGAESFYNTRKALGIHGSVGHSCDIGANSYWKNRFVAGLDLEKLIGVAWSGINTRSGDLLTLKMSGLQMGTGTDQVTQCYITLIYDAICSISDQGVQVFD
jgi:hypothetical protein